MSVPGSVKQLIERMLAPHKQHPFTPGERTMLEYEIAATDRQLDELVYELHGLTEKENEIVEEQSAYPRRNHD